MGEFTVENLIAAAASVLNPHTVGDRFFTDVGSALVSDCGNLYSGVCVDTYSGTGFCAEHAAVAAMVTAGEYRIAEGSPSRARGAGAARLGPTSQVVSKWGL